MKVLLLSLFHPELVRGGAQQVAYELFRGLKETPGIEPVLLCAVQPDQAAFYKSGACITGFDGRPDEYLFLSRGYDFLWHRLPEPALLDAYAEFLELIRPDVVHVHHFMLFGIDLLTLTRRVLPQARIVLTFHEFMAICEADGHMVRTTDQSLCSRASSARCHQCLPERPPEHFFMRTLWMKRHLAAVDVFTTPSRFMIEHYVTWGIPREKIVHVTNAQRDYAAGQAKPAQPKRRRNRFGFFGQLVDVKGVWLLLEAVRLLRSQGFEDFHIEINGDNLRYASDARRAELENFLTAENALPLNERRVVFNGSYGVEQLPHRMARIDWVVVPSVWWEIFGLVISEALMFRKPVIVPDMGGPAERVRPGVDGLHFLLGDASSLAGVIREAVSMDYDRMQAGLAVPPPRRHMLEGFVRNIYPAAPITARSA